MRSSSEHDSARELLDFIESSPSPWHAAAEMVRRVVDAGGRILHEEDDWALEPGGLYAVDRGGSSVIAFRVGRDPAAGAAHIIGAHTDSPGFRVKPSGFEDRGGLRMLGTEIYGGPILATFTDRDLRLVGRVVDAEGVETLFASPGAVARLPNLAIHMNRTVNTEGLKLDPDEQLYLVFGDGRDAGETTFRDWVAAASGVPAGRIAAWDIAVVDAQPGTLVGPDDQFIASARLDNLASCHAALEALLATPAGKGVAMVAAFDHEEVGSESFKGASGSFLSDVVHRIAETIGADWRRQAPRSWLLSADMAHAWHPSHAGSYDEAHAPRINEGPAIKINARQRYATDAAGEALFAGLCDRAGVPCQRYVHRVSLPCGSTIGPMASANLGVRTVDVGNPMWGMHSIRETAGTRDHHAIIQVFRAFFDDV